MNWFRCMLISAVSTATLLSAGAHAQAPAPVESTAPSGVTSAAPAASSPVEQLAWLRGCWAGKAERFDFIEQWSAVRAGMMVGINHTTVQDRKPGAPARTQDYGYLRLEARDDGVYYVVIPSGKKETAFKLASAREENGRMTYTFTNPGDEFPQRIVYTRGHEGWVYAQVAGKIGNEAKEVTYPMRHVDCATGALISD